MFHQFQPEDLDLKQFLKPEIHFFFPTGTALLLGLESITTTIQGPMVLITTEAALDQMMKTTYSLDSNRIFMGYIYIYYIDDVR